MNYETTIGDVRLIHGRCEDVFPSLDGADHMITDPPYEKEAHTPVRRTHRSIRSGEKAELGFDAITHELRDTVAEFGARRVNGWSLVFCQVEAVHTWRDSIEAHGAKYKRAMAWVKPDASPQFNGQGPAQGFETIVASWSGAGASRWNGGGRRGVFSHLCNKGRVTNHPTEKPLSLMVELVRLFTNPGDTVCDPFMGSGATAVACAKMGRPFIGIEADANHYAEAVTRLEELHRQPDLLTGGQAKPTQSKLFSGDGL